MKDENLNDFRCKAKWCDVLDLYGSISERALRWALKLFKLLELELRQNDDKVLWSMKQVGEEPYEFLISCSFEEEPLRISLKDFEGEIRAKIGERSLSGSELNQIMELYLGPLVSYLQHAKAEWIVTRAKEDLSYGRLKSLGERKFKLGKHKFRARGFKFLPSGETRLALPVLDAEFWIAEIKGKEVLILSDINLSGPISRSYVGVREMRPRD